VPWQKKSSRVVYHNRYMDVTEEELITDLGDPVTYGIVHKKPAVLIIPWDKEKTTLIGQYRYPVDFFSWEWPAGHYEHSSVEDTARAELEEEAGIKAGKLTEIGTFHIAPGHLTQVCHVFLATELSKGQQELETAEKGMQSKTVTLAEMRAMIKAGEIKDGLTLSALQFFQLHLSQKQYAN